MRVLWAVTLVRGPLLRILGICVGARQGYYCTVTVVRGQLFRLLRVSVIASIQVSVEFGKVGELSMTLFGC